MIPDDPDDPARAPCPGDHVLGGRYVLEAMLADTGDSTLWIALDTQTERRVVITRGVSPASQAGVEERVRAEKALLERVAERARPTRKPKKRSLRRGGARE